MKRAMSKTFSHGRMIRQLADGEFHMANKKQIIDI